MGDWQQAARAKADCCSCDAAKVPNLRGAVYPDRKIDELQAENVALKGRVRALMEENVRLEMRAERAVEMLSQPWHRPDRVRAILRGDA